MKHTITAKQLIEVVDLLKHLRDDSKTDIDTRVKAARLCGSLGWTLDQLVEPVKVEIEGVPV